VITGSSEVSSRSPSMVRATTPGRIAGAWNLESSSPTAAEDRGSRSSLKERGGVNLGCDRFLLIPG
jgi:hypothetical protein